MKSFLKYLCIAFAFYATAHFCQKQTEGFTLQKISTHLLNAEKSALDASALSQRYFYKTKGGQSYVFFSEDGRFVLKFFRSSRLNTLRLLHPMFPFLSSKIQEQETELQEMFQSYILANTRFQEETALLGTHFSKKQNLCPSLKIVDKLGIEHTINPNHYPFVLQKKALLVKEKIKSMQNPQEAKKALQSLVTLLQKRIARKMEDDDPNLSKNFGFIGQRAVQIDGGRFSLSSSPSIEKILSGKEDLQHWLNRYYPELSQDFDREMQGLKNCEKP